MVLLEFERAGTRYKRDHRVNDFPLILTKFHCSLHGRAHDRAHLLKNDQQFWKFMLIMSSKPFYGCQSKFLGKTFKLLPVTLHSSRKFCSKNQNNQAPRSC